MILTFVILSSVLGSKPVVLNAQSAFNFSCLILFTVVLSAPHHQPFLLVQALDWHWYQFLVPVARLLGCT